MYAEIHIQNCLFRQTETGFCGNSKCFAHPQYFTEKYSVFKSQSMNTVAYSLRTVQLSAPFEH